MSKIEYYLTTNYAPLSGIVFLLIFLFSNATLDKKIKRLFYLIIGLEIVELVACNFEVYYAKQITFSPLRIWFAGLGHCVRPILIFLTIKLIRNDSNLSRNDIVLTVLLFVNTLISFSPFFTDIVYSYDVNNQLVRGPLGYLPNIIVAIYLIVFFIYVLIYMKSHKKFDKTIIFSIIMFLMCCMILEMVYSIRSIGRTSIVLSTIFFYMYFQSKQYLDVIDEERQKSLYLKDIVTKDNLTGLLNKQGFSDALDSAINNMLPTDSLALLFFDIDYFKQVNDVFGHIYGDRVLKTIAKNLRSVFHKPDLIGRFGGDEFYVLIKNNGESEIIKKLSSIQKKSFIEHTYQNRKILTSVSIGVAVLDGKTKISYIDFLKSADEALYKAKNNGKNQYYLEYLKK